MGVILQKQYPSLCDGFFACKPKIVPDVTAGNDEPVYDIRIYRIPRHRQILYLRNLLLREVHFVSRHKGVHCVWYARPEYQRFGEDTYGAQT